MKSTRKSIAMLAALALLLSPAALADSITFTGTVAASETCEVYAPIGGKVQAVNGDVGDRVSADTVLVELSTTKVCAEEDGTVTERTTEIGLKKALGAIPWQIQAQFLIESFLLSIIGGALGILLGLTLSLVLSKVMGTGFAISTFAIVLGAGFSAAVGIIFGWAPARKASRLNPIDALRSA